jgi:hypothetical protein
MSRRIELVLVIRQETILLPKVEPKIAQGVHVAIKVRYIEPKLNQHNENIVKRVSKD